jgi:AcrR family transcriptional regulator
LNQPSPTAPETGARRERERLLRRQAILSAAERVFALHGFEAATIEQIAREAEYAAGTIYLYFKDKQALYAALIAGKLSAMVDLVETIVRASAPADPVGALRNAIRTQFEFHDQNRGFFEVLLRHHPGPPPAGREDWESIERTLRRHHAILVDLIVQCQRRKLIRAGESLDYAVALLGMVIHLTHEAMKAGGRPLLGKADFVFDLFMTGARRP